MTSPYGASTATPFGLSGNNTVDAFINWGVKWGGGGIGTSAVVTFSFPQSNLNWLSGYGNGEPFDGFKGFSAAQQQATRQALSLWSDVANITFQEVSDTANDVGDIRFGFSHVVTMNPSAIAWGYFPETYPEAGDIWFDPNYRPNLQMAPGQFGFYTLLHEIGHAIGLDHPFDDGVGEPVLPSSMDNNQYTVMAYDVHPRASVEAVTPMLLDILAIQHIYGANMTTRIGDDVYKFSTTEQLRAIWDAGGIDTIDASNQTLGATIDLDDGAFSSIGKRNAGGSAQNNIAIAYGAIIENALGGSGSDKIFGNEVNNALTGNAGNDTLDGEGGADLLRGGKGNDIYIVDNVDDVVDEQGNKDLADEVRIATSINLTTFAAGLIERATALGNAVIDLTGNAAANILTGNSAVNVIDGGTGRDTMKGGAGNDLYFVNVATDVIDEQGNKDTGDEVRSTVTINLAALGKGQIEIATLLGTAAIGVTGSALANLLTGNDAANALNGAGGSDTLFAGGGNDKITDTTGNNIVDGGAGNDNASMGTGNDTLMGGVGNDTLAAGAGHDILDGGIGNDAMNGGAGSDIYIIDNVKDTVTDSGKTDINDEVRSIVTVDLSKLGAGLVEHATLLGSDAINAFGNASSNRLTGNDNVNILVGLAGNDTLDGGMGNDTLVGGIGNDSYAIDSLGDLVNEESNNDSSDTVRGAFNFDLSVFAAGKIENAVLLGTDLLNATGNNASNSLTGNSAANLLDGGAGNDTLDGGDGTDVMTGGAGNDIYFVDRVADTVDEAANLDTSDEVRSAFISIDLADFSSIENATLLGALSLDLVGDAGANKLTGNNGSNLLDGGSGNDVLRGGAGSDTYVIEGASDVVDEQGNKDKDDVVRATNLSINLVTFAAGLIEHAVLSGAGDFNLTGNAAANRLTGNDGKNVLDGGAGNDTLDGGLGSDAMKGGAGNDVYVVDDLADTVNEGAFADKADEVQSATHSFNLATFAAGKIEHATLLGGANLSVTGSTAINRLTGNGGNNSLDGAAGNDTLDGGNGNDTLLGGIGNDALTGGAGNDLLDGGAGIDTMRGGAGNDVYVIDVAGDVIDEQSNADAGDEVRSDTLALDLTKLDGGTLEHATLLGAANLSITGNNADNILTGNSGNNVISGAFGNDVLIGGIGNDTLDGGVGDDVLKSGAGGDLLRGGDGNDIYYIENAAFTLEEGYFDTADEVRTTVSANLGAVNIEIITLLGAAAIDVTGNYLDNKMTGNSAGNVLDGSGGNDYLDGKAGDDTLRGGEGDDILVIDSAGDKIEEQAFGGADEVQSQWLSLNLQSIGGGNVEHARLLGAVDLDISGTANFNKLYGNDGSNIIDGIGGNDTIDGGAGDDTLIGGAGNDRLYGGAGNDEIHVTDLKSDTFEGGNGFDSVIVEGSGLDLSFGWSTLLLSESIERIDISGTGANHLHLGPGDVVSLGSSLRVDGDSDDSVTLQFGLEYVDAVTIDGKSYKHYASGMAELFIDGDMTVHQDGLASLRYSSLDGAFGFNIANALASSAISVRDLNNDGYDDVVLGDAGNGSIVLIQGDSDRPLEGLDANALGDAGAVLSSNQGGYLGWSVDSGDFNGDGVADIAVGAPQSGQGSSGRAYVLFGNEDGSLPVVDLTKIGASDGFYVGGTLTSQWAGAAVRMIGDMNGDGYDELLVGVPRQGNPSHPGTAYIAYGQPSISDPANTLEGPNVDIIPVPITPFPSFGSSASSGDFDGDGRADVIVGGGGQEIVFFGNGTAGQARFTFPGTSVGTCGGDFNGDGYDDIVIQGNINAIIFGGATLQTAELDVNKLDGSNGVLLTGITGSGRLTLAGDLNGDGFDDLIVGDANATVDGLNSAGRVSVIFGRSGSFDSKLDVTDHVTNGGFDIVGEAPTQTIGIGVQMVGDLDGDGFDELLITNNWGAADRAAILYGQTFGLGESTVGSVGNDVLNGDNGGNMLAAAQGHDTVNGGGGADAISGGQGNDHIHVADNSFFRIDGGAGVDTLHLDYSGAIDFGNLDGNASTSDRGRIEDVEILDADNGQSNVMTLHIADVLDLDVANSNVGGNAALDNVLRIEGDTGDTLQMFNADGWGAADTSSLAGYAIYSYQAVKVAIDSDIAVSFA